MGDHLPFKGKLLVCDMDGTLLNGRNEVSEENKKAIADFIKGGGLFTLATGRSAMGVAQYVNELSVNFPVITMNGSQIYDFKTSRVIWQSPLLEDVYSVLCSLIEEFPGMGIEIFTERGAYIVRENHVTRWHRRKEFMQEGTVEMRELKMPWSKIVLAWDNEKLKRVEAFLQGKTGTSKTVFCEEVFLDLLNMKTSKGAALEYLIAQSGIPSEQVIAIGDNLNDLEMIRAAGVGVAVENANPELKEHADMVSCHHEEHAVSKVIRWIEKGRAGGAL